MSSMISGNSTPTNWYDEYMDMMVRANQLATENGLLSRRQHMLEECVRTLVERNINPGGRCALGECEPQWDQRASRHVHVDPCSLAHGERLLREHLSLRRHYGKEADVLPPMPPPFS